MQYKRLYEDAEHLISPQNGDAGYDLPAYGFHRFILNEIISIPTGIAVAIPKGYVGIIYGRSGNAFKRYVECFHNGVIDSSYRGEIQVMLKNEGYDRLIIEHGDKIAQLVIVPAYTARAIEVDTLDETERGDKGFGSSGIIGG